MIEFLSVGMIVPALGLAKMLFEFFTTTKKNSSDIKEVQKDLKEVSEQILKISLALQYSRDLAETDKKIFLLELDALLAKHGIPPLEKLRHSDESSE